MSTSEPDHQESIDELRSRLDAAADESEQAELLDGIWLALVQQNQPLEALQYCSRALELRRRAADRDPASRPRLATALFNHGQLLTWLGRTEEALDSHLAAHRIYDGQMRDSPAILTDSRAIVGGYARNAAGLAAALSRLHGFDMAARFQGAALGAYLGLATTAAFDISEAEVNDAIATLGVYLDSIDSAEAALHPRPSLSSHVELMSFLTRSSRVAERLLGLVVEHNRRGRIESAMTWATRMVRYCDLFATEDAEFARASVEMLRQLAAWSASSGVTNGLVAIARLKGLLDVRVAASAQHHPGTTAAPGMNGAAAVDRRLWCCSARDLLLMIADLARDGIPASDVHTLAGRLRAHGLYPARDYHHRCQPRLPDLFITYDWHLDFVALQNTIHRTLLYVGERIHQARRDLDSRRILSLVLEEIGLWIDFVFIDQSARDVGDEVRRTLPQVIEAADVHLVISPTALTRSWCCYELAVFNRRPVPRSAFPGDKIHGIDIEAYGPLLGRPLRSIIAERQTLEYRGFADTATTVPGDKIVIEQYLREEFPEGMSGIDLLLGQVSLLSDPWATPGFAQYPGAEDTVLSAADRWLAR
jgi:tetratricopeptide (TPR) repeat protein